MDPVSLIVSALATGATMRLRSDADPTVMDAYVALRHAVREELAYSSSGQSSLDDFERDPAWDSLQDLAEDLQDVRIDRDSQIVELAQRLIELIDPRELRLVDISGAHGVPVGDHNNQVNYFPARGPVRGSPPGPDFDDK